MHGERNNRDSDDLAAIWRDAQHRRNDDLRASLRDFAPDTEAPRIERSRVWFWWRRNVTALMRVSE
jgi:hypothetical protein